MVPALEQLKQQAEEAGYIADKALSMSLWLMLELERPLLLEGDAGVGKTEVGKTMAIILDRPLIRLQCYEGLDVNTAVYEWNYQRQLLNIRMLEMQEQTMVESELFSDRFLSERPLLQAIRGEQPSVLLIDEIDRADEEFEAYLLEVLSDFQISIPELGTITASSIPSVILTSNGTRELSDALRRRCLYHYIDYPSFDKELAIVNSHIPEINTKLASQIVAFVQQLRREDLRKTPGVAETLDWTCALLKLDMKSLGDNSEAVLATLGCLLKTHEDVDNMPKVMVEKLLAKAR